METLLFIFLIWEDFDSHASFEAELMETSVLKTSPMEGVSHASFEAELMETNFVALYFFRDTFLPRFL